MVWPLPGPWSETMVSTALGAQKTLEIKGFLGLERPFLDLVSQTPRPRGRGRPLFAEFKKALLQNPREMIRGRIFSEMIRIQARKSESQAESRSYGPKVGDTTRQTPRIRTESPRKGPRMGFRCFFWNPLLKPSWIHLTYDTKKSSYRHFRKIWVLVLVVRIARPTSLAIWHRGCSHRRPNRSGSPNRSHFASLDLKKHPDVFASQANIAGFSQAFVSGIFLRFQIKHIRIASEKKIACIASDLGMCDWNLFREIWKLVSRWSMH